MTSHVKGDVCAHLRAHPGVKFSPTTLSRITGHSVRDVTRALAAARGDPRLGIHRELGVCPGASKAVYWVTDKEDVPADTVEGRQIARWLARHRKAARPSVIASAVGMDPAVVARELEEWANRGAAVRCELVTREGIDRFEYRLSEVAGVLLGRAGSRPYGSRFL